MARNKREKISRLEKRENRQYRAKSLYTSLIISISCVIMSCFCLLGTTYALFTDSAFTSGNYIRSGVLKVVLFLCDEEANINPDNMIYSEVENEESELKVDGDENLLMPGDSIEQMICVRNEGNILSQYTIGFSINDPVENDGSLANILDVYYAYIKEDNANQDPYYFYLGKLIDVINESKHIIGNLAAIKVDELSVTNEDEIPSSSLINIKISLPDDADYDMYSDSSLSLSLTLSSSQAINNIYTFEVEHYLYESALNGWNEYLRSEDNEIISGPGAYYFDEEVVLDTLDSNGYLKAITYDGKIYKLKGFYQLVDGEFSNDNYTELNDTTDYSFKISSNVKYRLRYEFEEVAPEEIEE